MHLETLDSLLLKTTTIEVELHTRDKYIENIIQITTECNLPFTVWSHKAMKNQDGFSRKYNVTCSTKSVASLLAKFSDTLRERMTNQLHQRRLCLKFDIASRKGRSNLGIAAQCVYDWDWTIHYLSMHEILGREPPQHH